jgi:hypothetical protein
MGDESTSLFFSVSSNGDTLFYEEKFQEEKFQTLAG